MVPVDRANRSSTQAHKVRAQFALVLLCCVAVLGVFTASSLASSLSWSRPVHADSATSAGMYALTCPSLSLCVGVDGKGNIVTSTDPTAGSAAKWTTTNVEQARTVSGWTGILDVSCASATLCLAVDSQGFVLTSADPGAGSAAAWAKEYVDPGPLVGVTCASASLCLISGASGELYSSTNPAAGNQANWSLDSGAPRGAYAGVASCPSAALCLLGGGVGGGLGGNGYGNDGSLLSSTDPGNGPTAQWETNDVEGGNPASSSTASPLKGLSCPAVTLCIGVDAAGNTLTSPDASDGTAATWATKNVLGHNSGGYYHSFTAISCPLVTFCVAVGDHGRANEVATSDDPAAGAKASWTVDTKGPDPDSTLTLLSCPLATLCIAGDVEGDVTVGTPSKPSTGKHRHKKHKK
jgi:hypothetical protein